MCYRSSFLSHPMWVTLGITYFYLELNCCSASPTTLHSLFTNLYLDESFKGLHVILCDPRCKDLLGTLKKAFVWSIKYQCFKLFIFSCGFSAKLTLAFLVYEKRRAREKLTEINPFLVKERLYSFDQIKVFKGIYRCKSGIAIFAWRISWYYAYSPFKYRDSKKQENWEWY